MELDWQLVEVWEALVLDWALVEEWAVSVLVMASDSELVLVSEGLELVRGWDWELALVLALVLVALELALVLVQALVQELVEAVKVN